jgi:hypothetical protein
LANSQKKKEEKRHNIPSELLRREDSEEQIENDKESKSIPSSLLVFP